MINEIPKNHVKQYNVIYTNHINQCGVKKTDIKML